MFARNRAQAGAQAKETAGNLTGSGFANTLGTAIGRSTEEENSFLAQLMSGERQANANRFAGLLGIPGQTQGQVAYQPGFLDYWMQALQAAGPAIAAAAA